MRIDFNNNTLIITLYDDSNLWKLLKAVTEIECYLGKKLSLDFNGASEVLIDVDDYYEYVTLRRKILDYTPIY